VGSGSVPQKTRSTSEEPSSVPDSSSSEPEPPTEPATSTPSTFEEPASTPQTDSETSHATKPPAPAKADGRAGAVEVAVGAGTPLASPKPPQASDVAGAPVAAAALTDPGGQASSDSFALLPLVVILLGLVLTYAGIRLWRLHERRRLDALWYQRDVTWEAAVRQIETKQARRVSKPSARKQKIDVG